MAAKSRIRDPRPLNDLFRVPPRHPNASSSPLHSFVVDLYYTSCKTLDLCLEIHEPIFQSLSRGLVRITQTNKLQPALAHSLGSRCRLFKHKPHHDPLLLLYRDDPCVVIGRNQNPWKEVNMTELRRAGIPFIRRRSGGGTVYHVSVLNSGNITDALKTPLGPRQFELLDSPSEIFIRPERFGESRGAGRPIAWPCGRERE